MTENEEEKKYRWRLRSASSRFAYLNIDKFGGQMQVGAKYATDRTETHFTEDEYKKIASKHYFDVDAFVKEEIE